MEVQENRNPHIQRAERTSSPRLLFETRPCSIFRLFLDFWSEAVLLLASPVPGTGVCATSQFPHCDLFHRQNKENYLNLLRVPEDLLHPKLSEEKPVRSKLRDSLSCLLDRRVFAHGTLKLPLCSWTEVINQRLSSASQCS